MSFFRTKNYAIRLFNISDISENYLKWFSKPNNQFIVHKTYNLKTLKKYCLEKINDKKILFFAIVDLKSGIHIGNLKIEVERSNFNTCTLGIFIGETKFQGKGVFFEIFLELKKWLKKNTSIKKIKAGVDIKNIFSKSAFIKCGFKQIKKNSIKISYQILI